jgi:hypothetical protein
MHYVMLMFSDSTCRILLQPGNTVSQNCLPAVLLLTACPLCLVPLSVGSLFICIANI